MRYGVRASFPWRHYSQWHSHFLCAAHHNRDTGTPVGSETTTEGFGLFRLIVLNGIIKLGSAVLKQTV